MVHGDAMGGSSSNCFGTERSKGPVVQVCALRAGGGSLRVGGGWGWLEVPA